MKYAVIRKHTVHHEGDERSRTNPGHGYPAYDEDFSIVENFDSEEAMVMHYRFNKKPGDKYIKYTEVEFDTEVKIRVMPA